MLRGFVNKGIITNQQKDDFLNSVETIAGEIVDDMNAVLAGNKHQELFLKKYGHLRPGSYDITSYNYREKPEYYFPTGSTKKAGNISNSDAHLNFEFDDQTLGMIAQEIDRMELNTNVDQLLKFIKEATASREYAKFQFTKNLDAVLGLIAEWGKTYGFDRAQLSYLFIKDILHLNKFTVAKDPLNYLNQKIQEGKNWYQESNKIETPQIITSPQDLDIIEHNVAEPNYVTSNMVTAQICNLTGITDKAELEGQIVLQKGPILAMIGYSCILLKD